MISATFPRQFVVAFLLLILASSAAAAEGLGRATVSGVVTDDSGEPLPGITVTATRAGEGGAVAVSDGSGTFRLEGLRPGSYVMEAALDGFQPVSREVTLVTNQTLQVAFKLVPAFSETVTVTAEAARTGEVAILETRRQAAVVSDSISAEEIRRTPDSSAASVVERLTGVTLLGDKYVYVRGLGERYSGTTLNGATMPTTESDKRVVPLDLFPAKLLETVNVVKTYTPDKPADFGSGVVEMTTIDFPGAATLRVSVGAGYQSSATGNGFRQYAGGLNRWGRGGQSLPSEVPAEFLKRQSALDPTGLSAQELEAIGEAFVGDWSGEASGSASPATDFSLTYGNTFGKLGVVLSAVSNHKFDTVDEELRFFGLGADNELVPRNDYVLVADRESANTGLVGNFSLRLSESNRVYFNSVLTRDASSERREQQGLNTNAGGFIQAPRVRYQIEEILSTRLRGEHNLPGPGIASLIEWSLSRSEATNDSDLRETIYRERSPGVFDLQVGLAESSFFNLEDGIQQGGAAYSVFYSSAGGTSSGSIKGGIDYLDRNRDFGARRFRWSTPNQLQFDLSGTPEEIFTPENIGPTGFEIREVTGVNDAYTAEHKVGAAYLMVDSTFGKWRVITGARFEDSDQRVSTFNPFDTSSAVTSINESADVLPSLNVVYQAGSQTNLRFAYGRSLNRPEFRELSPFAFVEVSGGRSVSGNPDLKQATLDGFDARWERFPTPSEVVAASVFYKRIGQPIERVIQPTTELRTSFVNAESATLWGAELEFRRSLESFSPSLRRFSVNMNYAYINSDVRVGEQLLSVATNLERPLEGQSDQVGNVALQFLQPEWGMMVRLLANHAGARLTDVGAYGLPDIYEAAATTFDAVISQSLNGFGPGVELKLGATNLFDTAREFTQQGATQRRYQPGRTVSLSLSYTPF